MIKQVKHQNFFQYQGLEFSLKEYKDSDYNIVLELEELQKMKKKSDKSFFFYYKGSSFVPVPFVIMIFSFKLEMVLRHRY